jgi:hypothetical protein
VRQKKKKKKFKCSLVFVYASTAAGAEGAVEHLILCGLGRRRKPRQSASLTSFHLLLPEKDSLITTSTK